MSYRDGGRGVGDHFSASSSSSSKSNNNSNNGPSYNNDHNDEYRGQGKYSCSVRGYPYDYVHQDYYSRSDVDFQRPFLGAQPNPNAMAAPTSVGTTIGVGLGHDNHVHQHLFYDANVGDHLPVTEHSRQAVYHNYDNKQQTYNLYGDSYGSSCSSSKSKADGRKLSVEDAQLKTERKHKRNSEKIHSSEGNDDLRENQGSFRDGKSSRSKNKNENEDLQSHYDNVSKDGNAVKSTLSIEDLLQDERLKNVLFAGISKATAKLEQSLKQSGGDTSELVTQNDTSLTTNTSLASNLSQKPKSILKRKTNAERAGQENEMSADSFNKLSALEKTLRMLRGKTDIVAGGGRSEKDKHMQGALGQLTSYSDSGDEEVSFEGNDKSRIQPLAKHSRSETHPFWSVEANRAVTERVEKELESFDVKEKLYEQWRQSINSTAKDQRASLKEQDKSQVNPFFKKTEPVNISPDDALKSTECRDDEELDSTVQNVLQSIGFNFDLSKRMQELARQKKKQQDVLSTAIINQSATFLGKGEVMMQDVRAALFSDKHEEAHIESLIKEVRASAKKNKSSYDRSASPNRTNEFSYKGKEYGEEVQSSQHVDRSTYGRQLSHERHSETRQEPFPMERDVATPPPGRYLDDDQWHSKKISSQHSERSLWISKRSAGEPNNEYLNPDDSGYPGLSETVVSTFVAYSSKRKGDLSSDAVPSLKLHSKLGSTHVENLRITSGAVDTNYGNDEPFNEPRRIIFPSVSNKRASPPSLVYRHSRSPERVSRKRSASPLVPAFSKERKVHDNRDFSGHQAMFERSSFEWRHSPTSQSTDQPSVSYYKSLPHSTQSVFSRLSEERTPERIKSPIQDDYYERRSSKKSPHRYRNQSPFQCKSRSSKWYRSRSPGRYRSRSTDSQISRSSRRQISESPRRRVSGSPGRRASRSPDRRASRSPGRRASRSPGRRVSRSPVKRVSRSRGRRVSRSPDRRMSRSPDRRMSRSPDRRVPRSPSRRVSRSPERRVSRSPNRKVSRSPGRRMSRFHSRGVSRSPGSQMSRSPSRRVSRSPGRRVSRFSGKQMSRSPDRRLLRSPQRQISISPRRHIPHFRSSDDCRKSPEKHRSQKKKRRLSQKSSKMLHPSDKKQSSNNDKNQKVSNEIKKNDTDTNKSSNDSKDISPEYTKVDVFKLPPEGRRAHLQKLLEEKVQASGQDKIEDQTMIERLADFPLEERNILMIKMAQMSVNEKEMFLHNLSLRQVCVSALKTKLDKVEKQQNEILRKCQRGIMNLNSRALLETTAALKNIEKELKILNTAGFDMHLAQNPISTLPSDTSTIGGVKDVPEKMAELTKKPTNSSGAEKTTKKAEIPKQIDEKKKQLPSSDQNKTTAVTTADGADSSDTSVKERDKLDKETKHDSQVSSSSQKANRQSVSFEYNYNCNYWCKHCSLSFQGLQLLLQHNHSAEHLLKIEHEKKPWKDNRNVHKMGRSQTRRIKGAEMMFPSVGFYCSLCKVFCGDFIDSSDHLKSQSHYDKYVEYVKQNPLYENSLLLEKNKTLAAVKNRSMKETPPQPMKETPQPMKETPPQPMKESPPQPMKETPPQPVKETPPQPKTTKELSLEKTNDNNHPSKMRSMRKNIRTAGGNNNSDSEDTNTDSVDVVSGDGVQKVVAEHIKVRKLTKHSTVFSERKPLKTEGFRPEIEMKVTKEDENQPLDKFLTLEQGKKEVKQQHIPLIVSAEFNLSDIPIPKNPHRLTVSTDSSKSGIVYTVKSLKQIKEEEKKITDDEKRMMGIDVDAEEEQPLLAVPIPPPFLINTAPADTTSKIHEEEIKKSKPEMLDTLFAKLSRNAAHKNKPKVSPSTASIDPTVLEIEQKINDEIMAKLAQEKANIMKKKQKEELREKMIEEGLAGKKRIKHYSSSESDELSEDETTDDCGKQETAVNVPDGAGLSTETVELFNASPNLVDSSEGSFSKNLRSQIDFSMAENVGSQEMISSTSEGQPPQIKQFEDKQNDSVYVVNERTLSDNVDNMKETFIVPDSVDYYRDKMNIVHENVVRKGSTDDMEDTENQSIADVMEELRNNVGSVISNDEDSTESIVDILEEEKCITVIIGEGKSIAEVNKAEKCTVDVVEENKNIADVIDLEKSIADVMEELRNNVGNVISNDEDSTESIADILEEEKFITDIIGERKGIVGVNEDKKCIVDKIEESKNIVDVIVREKSIADIVDREKSIADVNEEEKSIADIVDREKSIADVNEKEKSIAEVTGEEKYIVDVIKEEKSIAVVSEEGKSISNVIEEGKNIADVTEEGKHIADVIEEGKTISDVNEEGKNIADVSEERKSIPDVIEEENSIADVIEEENSIAVAIEEGKTTSDVVEEGKSIADVIEEEKSIYNLIDGEKSIADVTEERQNIADVIEEGKTISNVNEEGKNIADVIKERKSIPGVIEEENSNADAVEEDKSIADVVEEEKSIYNVIDGEKSIADVIEEGKRIADVIEEGKRIADVIEEGKRIADVIEEGKRIADVIEEGKRIADVIEEGKRIADVTEEGKSIADVIEEGKRIADINDGKHIDATGEDKCNADYVVEEEGKSIIALDDTNISGIIIQEKNKAGYVVSEEEKDIVNVLEDIKSISDFLEEDDLNDLKDNKNNVNAGGIPEEETSLACAVVNNRINERISGNSYDDLTEEFGVSDPLNQDRVEERSGTTVGESTELIKGNDNSVLDVKEMSLNFSKIPEVITTHLKGENAVADYRCQSIKVVHVTDGGSQNVWQASSSKDSVVAKDQSCLTEVRECEGLKEDIVDTSLNKVTKKKKGEVKKTQVEGRTTRSRSRKNNADIQIISDNKAEDGKVEHFPQDTDRDMPILSLEYGHHDRESSPTQPALIKSLEDFDVSASSAIGMVAASVDESNPMEDVTLHLGGNRSCIISKFVETVESHLAQPPVIMLQENLANSTCVTFCKVTENIEEQNSNPFSAHLKSEEHSDIDTAITERAAKPQFLMVNAASINNGTVTVFAGKEDHLAEIDNKCEADVDFKQPMEQQSISMFEESESSGIFSTTYIPQSNQEAGGGLLQGKQLRNDNILQHHHHSGNQSRDPPMSGVVEDDEMIDSMITSATEIDSASMELEVLPTAGLSLGLDEDISLEFAMVDTEDKTVSL